MNSAKIHKESNTNITRQQTVKAWCCLILNESDTSTKWRASTPEELRRRFIESIQTAFACISTLCLKRWVVSIIDVLARKHELR